jgi:ankyrin repeat protein
VTPLIYALTSGRLKMARMLMDHPIAGPSVVFDTLDKNGNSAVLIAARYMWVALLGEMLPKLNPGGAANKVKAIKAASVLNTRYQCFFEGKNIYIKSLLVASRRVSDSLNSIKWLYFVIKFHNVAFLLII